MPVMLLIESATSATTLGEGELDKVFDRAMMEAVVTDAVTFIWNVHEA